MQNLSFQLPISSCGELWTLGPVIAAAAEVVQQRRAEIMVPGEAVDVARLVQIVVVRVIAGQSRGPLGPGVSRFRL